ncbi:MAG: hypothetical protein OIF35_07735 [Cellvibrionaceae bacterium]|nr:hypothetical protein [Cellvibrionaceae bacterium]
MVAQAKSPILSPLKMAWHQLGISLDAERVASIATFLCVLENTKRQ